MSIFIGNVRIFQRQKQKQSSRIGQAVRVNVRPDNTCGHGKVPAQLPGVTPRCCKCAACEVKVTLEVHGFFYLLPFIIMAL